MELRESTSLSMEERFRFVEEGRGLDGAVRIVNDDDDVEDENVNLVQIKVKSPFFHGMMDFPAENSADGNGDSCSGIGVGAGIGRTRNAKSKAGRGRNILGKRSDDPLDSIRRHTVGIACAILVVWALSMAHQKEIVESLKWHSSPVDWCEENYAVSSYVVEFWNTLSSATLCVVAIALAITSRSYRINAERGQIYWVISMFCVGLGSIYFHATLSVMGQVLDEMPICWLAFYAAILIGLRKTSRIRRFVFSPTFFVALALLTPIIAVTSPHVSHVLVVLTNPIDIVLVYQGYRRCKNSAANRKMFAWGIFFTLSAVACWLTDRFGCEHLVDMFGFRPQLHALWHVLVGFGAYCGIVVAQYISAQLDGMGPYISDANALGIPGTAV
eukprot:g1765.t1